VFNIEPGFSQEAIKAILSSRWFYGTKKNMFFGGVHTVLENSEGYRAGDRHRNRYATT